MLHVLPASVHCRDVNLSILGSNCNLNHSITVGSGTFVYEPGVLTVGHQYMMEVLKRQNYRHYIVIGGH